MWEIEIVCSDPECEAELLPLWVEDLDQAEAAACDCGCAVVALRVALYEPELPVRLTRAGDRELALH
ncbi:MAG: hypothetical protein ACOYD4_13900 [Solirubrobacterales bacterium]